MLDKWKDPIYRATQLAAMSAGRNTPEAKLNRSNHAKEIWANPKVRAKLVASAKRRWKRPEEKAKLALWKEQRIAGNRTPEARSAASIRSKAVWADPVKRAKRIRSLQASWGDPKKKARRVAAIKRNWASPCLYIRGNRVVQMHSWWEVAYAQYLDRKGVQWQYEPKFFYIGKGKYHGERYVPDFYLIASDEYIEVKGRESNQFRAKYRKFRKMFPKIRVQILRAKHLAKLGVLVIGGNWTITLSPAAEQRRLARKDGLKVLWATATSSNDRD